MQELVEQSGKNDIIVFSEKIKAVQAWQGFFVAREFTRDARHKQSSIPELNSST